jgi:hypothetical protein
MAAEGRRPEIAISAIHPKADIVERDRHVRFVPEADILRCGKGCRYSITSSARSDNAGGISIPIIFAVLRLITSSYLVGA